MIKLGVNIDHVATVREARRTFEPDPVKAAVISEKSGADSIVCHVRKDRRHINEKDLFALRKIITTKLNLEMSIDPEIVDIALEAGPDQATIVPENRLEITTEGGLEVKSRVKKIKNIVDRLSARGARVSLFIDPVRSQIKAAADTGAEMVEFHTGRYSEAFNHKKNYSKELSDLMRAAEFALKQNLVVAAGHGLTYDNVSLMKGIPGLYELNIGHSIISRAIFTGIGEAVKEMKRLIA
ncbi:MAG: pyridoxine 5'-phosphate synthase [Candidatus Omnitrophica bacterium]|nr:pyridoxine 5'-phosphate synthase [Candidatus Omnitrophota bacterium]